MASMPQSNHLDKPRSVTIYARVSTDDQAGRPPPERLIARRHPWGYTMLTDYINAAMRRARYEMLDDGTFYGEIPDFPGVWADAPTLEGCRDELQSVLEDWIVLALRRGDPLPVVDGIDLNIRNVA